MTQEHVVRHIVMWRVAGESAESRRANIELLQRNFEGLNGRIPGLIRLEVGADISRVDYACDVVLVSDFTSQEALKAYAVHPEHLRVKEAIGDVRISRHQVDYVVPTHFTPVEVLS